MTRAALENEFKSLSFLQGCWGRTNEQGQRVTEDWHKQTTGVMLGISQTINQDNSMQEYEFLEIRLDRTTLKITYTPWLNGRRLNTFTLDAGSKAVATPSAAFIDLENAALKKIVYTAKGPETLNVRLMGNAPDGGAFDFNFDLTREHSVSIPRRL